METTARVSLKFFRELKQLTSHELMTWVFSTTKLETMFPNLSKLAAISFLLPMSTVDCEQGFSALSRITTLTVTVSPATRS